jgi:diguanylate cyclase (GGDEF)-like protein
VARHSLYQVLIDQHGQEFAPVRCSQQTILRLVRYFEDVVTENRLSALVVQGRCLDGKEPSREAERLARLASEAKHLCMFSWEDDSSALTWTPEPSPKLTLLRESDRDHIEPGPFILVMDPRFSGLLASYASTGSQTAHADTYEMIWTFEPNVVFTAIQYLMARMSVGKPNEKDLFKSLLNGSTPHSQSLRLALSLTTKLTMLMQRQNELEMATNRISSAISSTLELESILQKAVEEVGRALDSRKVVLELRDDGNSDTEGLRVYERSAEKVDGADLSNCNEHSPVTEESAEPGQSVSITPGLLEVPIIYRNSTIGTLVVEDDTPGRNWEDEELLMVKTVSDQLAAAISHARLFRQVQTQAMTDELTGLFNHRYFQERLEREMRLADRNGDSVSLILLDLDHLKQVNDSLGHRAGDAALRRVAEIMRGNIREVDICARYGGEEFVVILPQCGSEGAIKVAERIREAIATAPITRIGRLTASLGVTSYPEVANTKEELIEMADRAMYLAKAAGRNRVETFLSQNHSAVEARRELLT